MNPSDVRPLTITDLARAFAVHRNTITRWMDNGRLPYTTDETGARVVTFAMLDAYQSELGKAAARKGAA